MEAKYSQMAALAKESAGSTIVHWSYSKQRLTPHLISYTRLTPHLISYTPPYTFNPFLKPPNISTFQNTKTRSTPQLTAKQRPPTNTTPNPNTQAKSKQPPSPAPQPCKTPKHKAPPNSTKTPKYKTKSKQPPSPTPHALYSPLHFQPISQPA